jgi:hypothetical protein
MKLISMPCWIDSCDPYIKGTDRYADLGATG